MKTPFILVVVLVTGCSSQPHAENPPMRPGGPNWVEVDKSVQRIKERKANKPLLVETERTQDQGFGKMSADDYASVLDAARSDVRKENPKMSDGDIENEATKRADEAKRKYELTFSRSAGSTYEWKKP